MADLIERKDALDCLDNRDFDSYEDYSRTFDAIEDIPSVNRWTPVQERLPEIDEDVLVYVVRKDGLGDSVITITQFSCKFSFIVISDYEVTHWMPLPEPPEKE